MPFNPDKFERATFEPRTKEVEVKALSDFFDKDEKPVWTIRGLNSNELHKAIAAANTQKTYESIIKAITETGDQTKAMKKALGIAGDTPGEVAKRLEMLVAGCMNPKITLPVAVKLAENFPVEFLSITNDITELTGMGFEHVKQKAALPKTKV